MEENLFKTYEACFTLDTYLHGQYSAFITYYTFFIYFDDSLKQIPLCLCAVQFKNTKTHYQAIVLYTRIYSNVIHYANML